MPTEKEIEEITQMLTSMKWMQNPTPLSDFRDAPQPPEKAITAIQKIRPGTSRERAIESLKRGMMEISKKMFAN